MCGNERADTLAKIACEESGKAKVVDGSQGGPRRVWVTSGRGGTSRYAGYIKVVAEGVREHRQDSMIGTENMSK